MEEKIKDLLKFIENGVEITTTSYYKDMTQKTIIINNIACNDAIWVEKEKLLGFYFPFSYRKNTCRIEEIEQKNRGVFIIKTPVSLGGYFDEIVINHPVHEITVEILQNWQLHKNREGLTKKEIFSERMFQDGI